MKELEFKQHHNGEWRLEASESNGITVMSGDKEIALIENNDTFLLTEQDWKHAQLISAAPDLLEALINFLEGVEELNNNHQEGWIDVIQQAKQAINKAVN